MPQDQKHRTCFKPGSHVSLWRPFGVTMGTDELQENSALPFKGGCFISTANDDMRARSKHKSQALEQIITIYNIYNFNV